MWLSVDICSNKRVAPRAVLRLLRIQREIAQKNKLAGLVSETSVSKHAGLLEPDVYES